MGFVTVEYQDNQVLTSETSDHACEWWFQLQSPHNHQPEVAVMHLLHNCKCACCLMNGTMELRDNLQLINLKESTRFKLLGSQHQIEVKGFVGKD